jgi:hypothetical protein
MRIVGRRAAVLISSIALGVSLTLGASAEAAARFDGASSGMQFTPLAECSGSFAGSLFYKSYDTCKKCTDAGFDLAASKHWPR